MNLPEFLTACVKDDERKALAAQQGHGFSDGVSGTPWHAVGSLLLAAQPDGTTERIAEVVYYGYDDVLIHAEQHDPARVLREVAAKRRVLERHCRPTPGSYAVTLFGPDCCMGCGLHGEIPRKIKVENVNDCPELRDMASVYEERPGYKEEWKL